MYPELAVTVYIVAMNHSTSKGAYVMLDIGSGTLDGTTFLFQRNEGTPEINILTSRVDAFGLDMITDGMWNSIRPENVKNCLITGFRKECLVSYLN